MQFFSSLFSIHGALEGMNSSGHSYKMEAAEMSQSLFTEKLSRMATQLTPGGALRKKLLWGSATTTSKLDYNDDIA